MVMKCGFIIRGEYAGQRWEITRQPQSKEHYMLTIGGKFWASSDNMRSLLDEVTALDKLPR